MPLVIFFDWVSGMKSGKRMMTRKRAKRVCSKVILTYHQIKQPEFWGLNGKVWNHVLLTRLSNSKSYLSNYINLIFLPSGFNKFE